MHDIKHFDQGCFVNSVLELVLDDARTLFSEAELLLLEKNKFSVYWVQYSSQILKN